MGEYAPVMVILIMRTGPTFSLIHTAIAITIVFDKVAEQNFISEWEIVFEWLVAAFLVG